MDGWTHIRVRESTRAALARMIESRHLTHQACHMTAWWRGDNLTFDEMIAWLIRHVERDRARSLASKRRAAENRREELLRAVFDIAAVEDQEED